MSNPARIAATLRDSERPYVRRVWPFEFSTWREHLKRLDAQTRRARFFGPVKDEFIDAYVDKAYGRNAIVYGAFVDGTMRAAGELQRLGGGAPAVGVRRRREGSGGVAFHA